MAFGFPASYETEIEVTGSRANIREAISRTFELFGWDFSTDEGANFFTARVPPGLSSFSEKFTVSLAEEPTITITSRCWIALFDWGKNRRNVEKFIEAFHTRLTWVSSLSDAAPVYLDDDGRTPIERLIDEPATSGVDGASFLNPQRNGPDE